MSPMKTVGAMVGLCRRSEAWVGESGEGGRGFLRVLGRSERLRLRKSDGIFTQFDLCVVMKNSGLLGLVPSEFLDVGS